MRAEARPVAGARGGRRALTRKRPGCRARAGTWYRGVRRMISASRVRVDPRAALLRDLPMARPEGEVHRGAAVNAGRRR